MKGAYSLSEGKLTLDFKDAAYGPVTVRARIIDHEMTLIQETESQRYRKVQSPCPVP